MEGVEEEVAEVDGVAPAEEDDAVEGVGDDKCGPFVVVELETLTQGCGYSAAFIYSKYYVFGEVAVFVKAEGVGCFAVGEEQEDGASGFAEAFGGEGDVVEGVRAWFVAGSNESEDVVTSAGG